LASFGKAHSKSVSAEINENAKFRPWIAPKCVWQSFRAIGRSRRSVAPPGPAGGAKASPRPPSRNKGVLLLREWRGRGGKGKEEKGRGGRGKGREERRAYFEGEGREWGWEKEQGGGKGEDERPPVQSKNFLRIMPGVKQITGTPAKSSQPLTGLANHVCDGNLQTLASLSQRVLPAGCCRSPTVGCRCCSATSRLHPGRVHH